MKLLSITRRPGSKDTDAGTGMSRRVIVESAKAEVAFLEAAGIRHRGTGFMPLPAEGDIPPRPRLASGDR